jgi:hypothetical protein
MLDERNDILVEGGKTVNAAGIVIAEVQYGNRIAAPFPANPMLVGERVRAAARVDADAKGLGDPLQLRNHT